MQAMVQLLETTPLVTLNDPDSSAHAWWETITPARAAELLDANDGNRNMRPRSVDAYSRDMVAGRWLVTGDTIKIARDGTVLDGQHRLGAILASGTPQKCLLVGGLEPEVRAVIDTGTARTGADALRMNGIGGGNATALAAAARIYLLWTTGRLTHMSSAMFGADRVTHSELLGVVRDNPDLEDAVRESVRDYTRNGLPVGPQAAARVLLNEIAANDAVQFFESIAGHSTAGKGDPRAALIVTVEQLRRAGEFRRPGEVLGLIFTAWNGWRDNQEMTRIATRDRRGKPLRIPTPV